MKQPSMDNQIRLAHGGGGLLGSALVQEVFLPAFGCDALSRLDDSAILELPGRRVAYTTDTYVVQPLFFPGGDIGKLSVCGTVNDLAVCGAAPVALAAGFVLEEGFEMETLRRIVRSMAQTAREVPVQIVTGDTKVVEKGAVDGLFITTTGLGVLGEDIELGADRIEPGDRILISGYLGDHGVAVLSEREGIPFETPVKSDVAPLASLTALMCAVGGVHAMRDPTRGGAAAALNELAAQSELGFVLCEEALPVRPEVTGFCDLLGLNPLTIANEGKVVAWISASSAQEVLEAVQAHPLGRNAALCGTVTDDHPGLVVMETSIGGRKIVELPFGEELPRIC